MNIVIKTPSFIGDTIMMLSAFELIKLEYPKAHITIICKDYIKDIFRTKGVKIIIDNTKSKNRFLNILILISKIRKNRYDIGFLFHNTFLDALIFKLSNINKIVGYDKENRRFLLDFSLKIDRTRHYINHYANLVNKFLNDKYTKLPKIELYHKDTDLLNKLHKRPLVGFLLGGDNKHSRKYPKNLSLDLMQILNSNINVVLLGDKNDTKNNILYENKLLKLGKNCINLSAKTSLANFIDVIAKLDFLVTIDSSAMHIASAVSTPFLVLVGKGSSAFDTVYPKVDFGSFIFKGEDCIKDEDLIYEIKPETINDKINKSLDDYLLSNKK